MKNFVLMFGIMILFTTSLAEAGYPPAHAPPRYRAARNGNGEMMCFPMDYYGNAFGSPVDDRYCAYYSLVAKNGNGEWKCFQADYYATIYGAPVEDQTQCLAYYMVGRNGLGESLCFMSDYRGQLYGDPVPDSYCQY